MADTARKFSKGELLTAVVIALAAGFFAGTVVMELRQPAGASVQAGAGAAAPVAETISPEVQGHISQLEVALATKPGDQAGWVELGNLYFDTHQAQKAVAAYEKAIALGQSSPDVWTDMGIMQREAGQPQKALASFDAALKLNPRHEHALYNKGVVLLHDTGDKAAAAEAWGRLLEVNPKAKTPDGRPLSDIVAELKRG
jgi:cytochrome c-type biogenesis protein CcmH/NrfG